MSAQQYDAYIGLMNELNTSIKNAGMSTMMFNDGVYYKGNNFNSYAQKLDRDIVICYWTGGNHSDSTELAALGFKLINTNVHWYYVAGNDYGDGMFGYKYAIKSLETKKCTECDGGGATADTGCMLAYWCDDPTATVDTTKLNTYIKTLADNNPDYFKTTAAPDKPGTKLEEREITVTVGGTDTDTIDGSYQDTYEPVPAGIATVETTIKAAGTGGVKVGDKIAVNNKNLPASVTGVISDGNGNYMMVSGNTIKNTKNVSDATQFTVTRLQNGTNGYKYRINSGDKYLKIDSSGVAISSSYYDNNRYNNDKGFYYSSRYSSYYLYYSNYYGWTSSNYGNGNGFLYSVEEVPTAPVEKTLVTFNGLAKGDTYVTIGNVHYTIHVTEEDLSNAPTLPIQLWITNNSIQPTADENFGKTGKFYTAGGTWQSQWAYYYPISADLRSEKNTDSVNSENGMALSECIPSVIQNRYQYGTNYWATDKGNHTPYNFTLWRGEVFNTSTGFQKSGQASMLNKGIADFQYVRYLNNAWQVSLDRSDWTTVTGEGSTGSVSSCKQQLVAYYYMQTELTKEVTTNVLDWGDAVNGQTAYALLDFAVKYPSGTRNPNTFIQPEKTRVYNTSGEVVTEGNYRLVDEISVIKEQGFEVYMITLTPATGLGQKISKTTTYEYEQTNEKVVWVDKVEDLPDDFKDSGRWYSALTNTGASRGLTFNADKSQNVGGDAIVPMVEIEKNSGTLVTYYIRPVKEETDTLQVKYVDLSDKKVFYNYSIAVNSGTTFEKEPTLTNGKLEDYTIAGLKATETVYSDLTKMDGVPAAYRYATNITCERVERSEGNTTLTLYYSFGRTTSFVVDFGLPVTIQPGDLNITLGTNIDRITKVTAVSSDGTASVVDKNVVFTPNKVYGVGSAKLAITYSGKNLVNNEENSVTYTIDILPASNVLYEENFLTEALASSGRNWTEVTSNKLGSQETQKVNGTGSYNVFGRDTAYDTATGELGVWKATGLVAGQGATKDLSTEFYGNGFDLIGNCGPDTGRVFLFISGANQIKLVDVDTRYSGGTFNQVPLAHVMLEQEANYQVKVSAAGLNATDTTSASYSLSGAATYASDYAVGGYDADLYNVLAENGLTMADVEYVKVESAPAATARSAAPFYALDTAAVGGAAARPAGTHVEIDGFRVYRSSANNTNYPKSEQDVRYLNILGAVDSFTAFVEGSAADSEWKARDKYESAGGPQNEIYLRETNGKNSAIAFKTEIGEVVQISARAVENNNPATLVVNGVATVIATNTEMYYTFTAGENGIVTIKNEGDGMLALGNLKIKKGTQVAALSEEDYPAAIALLSLNAAPETPDEGFNPAINAKVTTTRFIRSKVVTLTVSASSDVAVLEVNGVELRPTNSWLVKMGWSDTYTYILTEKVQKNEIKTYEIVGYRADGAASETIVVKSK